ncbi:MAG: hypothetical protein EA001_03995 [Oscillatoriales cyanobacterium]|nr:MAG: hypothetical protein EA001_03995 [Oscillatoriales cyanobacterium]
MMWAYIYCGNLLDAEVCFKKIEHFCDDDYEKEAELHAHGALIWLRMIERNYSEIDRLPERLAWVDSIPEAGLKSKASGSFNPLRIILSLKSSFSLVKVAKQLEGDFESDQSHQVDQVFEEIQIQKKGYQDCLNTYSSAIMTAATFHLCCHWGDFEQASLELTEIQSAATTIKSATLDFLALKSRGVLAYYRSDFAEALMVFSKCVEVATAGQLKVYAPLAHYYLAKTHQALFNQTQSNYHFQEAIDWLTKMGATRRIEQVQRAMQDPVQGLDMIW